MDVLVAYASDHGSTREIAERIGSRLERQGHRVRLGDVSAVELDVRAPFDAAVVGSAIHGGEWLREAVAFMHRNGDALESRPLWLFSVASVGDHGSALGPRATTRVRAMTRTPRQLARFRAAPGARDHRSFAGVVRPEHWGRVGRILFRAMGGRAGDHRDWDAIEAWADGIARALDESRARA